MLSGHQFGRVLAGAVLGLATIAIGSAARAAPTSTLSLDGPWLLAIDPQDEGKGLNWFQTPEAGAVATRVPWIIQDAFPGYHGIAWYWREFTGPTKSHVDGRYLIRFWAVDYKADVWLNGLPVGTHEGGEEPFVLDVTGAIRAGQPNRLAVRVVNPTLQPIDGLVLSETPHRNKVLPYAAGGSYNHGGITDSVELLHCPAVRIADLSVVAEGANGDIDLNITIQNYGSDPKCVRWESSVAPATEGLTADYRERQVQVPPGESLHQVRLRVPNRRAWELSEPLLYRVTARVTASNSESFDEFSARCGFREFRFSDGYFRLNGRRLLLRCSHTGNHCPVGLQLPPDPDMLRRDLINVKAMGFNAIRFIAGVATRRQLDLCDELGLLVYEEHYGSWLLADSPRMKERFDRSLSGMIRRDRNHPSIVAWGLLNETVDGPVFRHAAASLPLVRSLDQSRVIFLNSGRFDMHVSPAPAANPPGSLSNPGSMAWEDVLDDRHPYQRVPHTAEQIRALRTIGGQGKPVFVSEYGVASAVNLPRVTGHFERLGKENVEDALFYRDKLDRFLADWDRWKMLECFATPQDFFLQSERQMASERLYGLNALRANPRLVAYSLTGTVDQGMSGEGLFTTFRELKPGTTDALFNGLAPLRFCLFAEPSHGYRGAKVRLEAILANEDSLPPGKYPVLLQVLGPGGAPVLERRIEASIEQGADGSEPSLAIPFFSEEIAIDGAAGRYQFVAAMERGGAPAGGDASFFIHESAATMDVDAPIALWGRDAALAQWLLTHGVRTQPFEPTPSAAGGLILVSSTPPPGGKQEWKNLIRRVMNGATAIFLCPDVFREGDDLTRWLPLKERGTLLNQPGILYHKDEWAKAHPAFAGLPAGSLMDYAYYRDIVPDAIFSGVAQPTIAIAGANNASLDYSSGLMLAEYHLGAGRVILNTLLIREKLGDHPVAERLLRNLLRYGAQPTSRDAPATQWVDDNLRALGY